MDRAEDRLALIEWLGPQGLPVARVDVHRWPVTLGRGLDQTVVLDDVHVAPAQAVLEPGQDGRLQLHVLGGLNPVRLNGHPVAAGTRITLETGPQTLQLGQRLLRLRQRGETLGPEQALPPAPARQPRRGLWMMALGLWAMAVAEEGLSLDPDARLLDWLPAVIGLPLALMAWCALWALASKLFLGRFEFTGHLRTALAWLLALTLLTWGLPTLAAALGWPGLWRLTAPLQWLLLALMVLQHLHRVFPHHRRRTTLAWGVALASGTAVGLTGIYQETQRLSQPPYMSTLPLPALQWDRADPASTLLGQLPALAERVQAQAQSSRQRDADEAGSEEDDAE